MLGESISADTWVERQELLDVVGSERPFWLPRFFDGTQVWLDRMKKIAGDGGLDRLRNESKWYGQLMRKYQIEAYRREVPDGGYVVSVIRDVPSCSMGFLDYLGHPKWSADEWNWHGDTMLLLETDSDRRSFAAGETFRATPLISHFGPTSIENAQLVIQVTSPEADVRLLEQMTRKVASGDQQWPMQTGTSRTGAAHGHAAYQVFCDGASGCWRPGGRERVADVARTVCVE